VKLLVVMIAGLVLVVGGCSSKPEQQPRSNKTPTTSSAKASSSETEGGASPAEGAIEGRFDIGPRDLYLDCAGTGSPTVVLEAGDGVSSAVMGDVIKQEFADRVRVCSYDRANTGQSEGGPHSRDAQPRSYPTCTTCSRRRLCQAPTSWSGIQRAGCSSRRMPAATPKPSLESLP